MHQPADLHFLNCFKLLDLYINLGRYAHTLHAIDTADSDLIDRDQRFRTEAFKEGSLQLQSSLTFIYLLLRSRYLSSAGITSVTHGNDRHYLGSVIAGDRIFCRQSIDSAVPAGRQTG